MKLTFPEAITTNMKIGNDFFVFKYPVICKKNYQIFIIFIETNENVSLLCAHPLMKSIILHTRRTNCQKTFRCALGIYVSADFLFSHF